jgi:hypothetical protein
MPHFLQLLHIRADTSAETLQLLGAKPCGEAFHMWVALHMWVPLHMWVAFHM